MFVASATGCANLRKLLINKSHKYISKIYFVLLYTLTYSLAQIWADKANLDSIIMCLNVHSYVIFVHRPQIKTPETEYYEKMSSHAQIWPQGDEKQRSKVNVVVVVGGGCKGLSFFLDHVSFAKCTNKLKDLLCLMTMWSKGVGGPRFPQLLSAIKPISSAVVSTFQPRIKRVPDQPWGRKTVVWNNCEF